MTAMQIAAGIFVVFVIAYMIRYIVRVRAQIRAIEILLRLAELEQQPQPVRPSPMVGETKPR